MDKTVTQKNYRPDDFKKGLLMTIDGIKYKVIEDLGHHWIVENIKTGDRRFCFNYTIQSLINL